jgi:hypothetical protein
MAETKSEIVSRYTNLIDENDGAEKAKAAFILDVPRDIEGGPLFDALTEEYDGEELAEVAAETVLTLTAQCSADDFHNWDYDHLTSIIELSNRFGFFLPKNVVNGLPEQLIILVDHNKLGQPGCD